jgi:hypothetical protein
MKVRTLNSRTPYYRKYLPSPPSVQDNHKYKKKKLQNTSQSPIGSYAALVPACNRRGELPGGSLQING